MNCLVAEPTTQICLPPARCLRTRAMPPFQGNARPADRTLLTATAEEILLAVETFRPIYDGYRPWTGRLRIISMRLDPPGLPFNLKRFTSFVRRLNSERIVGNMASRSTCRARDVVKSWSLRWAGSPDRSRQMLRGSEDLRPEASGKALRCLGNGHPPRSESDTGRYSDCPLGQEISGWSR